MKHLPDANNAYDLINEFMSLKVYQCDCGFITGLDSQGLQNLKNMTFMCPNAACGKTINIKDIHFQEEKKNLTDYALAKFSCNETFHLCDEAILFRTNLISLINKALIKTPFENKVEWYTDFKTFLSESGYFGATFTMVVKNGNPSSGTPFPMRIIVRSEGIKLLFNKPDGIDGVEQILK